MACINVHKYRSEIFPVAFPVYTSCKSARNQGSGMQHEAMKNTKIIEMLCKTLRRGTWLHKTSEFPYRGLIGDFDVAFKSVWPLDSWSLEIKGKLKQQTILNKQRVIKCLGKVSVWYQHENRWMTLTVLPSGVSLTSYLTNPKSCSRSSQETRKKRD